MMKMIFKFDLYKAYFYKLNKMSYSNNKKLNYLLGNVFSKFNCNHLKTRLSDYSKPINLKNAQNMIHRPSRLEEKYPIRFFFRKNNTKKVSIETYDKEKKPSAYNHENAIDKKAKHEKREYRENTKYQNERNIVNAGNRKYNCSEVPKHNVDDIFRNNINLMDEINQDHHIEKLPKKPLQTSIVSTNDNEKDSTDINCNILRTLKKDNMNIIELPKKDDYYSNIFFSTLSNDFYILSMKEKVEYIKKMKLEVISKFAKDNFYRDYDYSTKLFKKSELDDTFSFNKNISVNMLKVYADILNVNCVYVYDNDIAFITKYNPDVATVVIEESNCKIYSLYRSNTYIRGSECLQELGVLQKYSKATLSKYKLDKLQNIAKMYNLNIKKKGKTGKVNVSREELIETLSVD